MDNSDIPIFSGSILITELIIAPGSDLWLPVPCGIQSLALLIESIIDFFKLNGKIECFCEQTKLLKRKKLTVNDSIFFLFYKYIG